MGLKFLEDLFSHFDAINCVNIGKNYCSKFGDPMDFLGKYASSLKEGISGVDKLSVCEDNFGDSSGFKSLINTVESLNKENKFSDPLSLDPAVEYCNSLSPSLLPSNSVSVLRFNACSNDDSVFLIHAKVFYDLEVSELNIDTNSDVWSSIASLSGSFVEGDTDMNVVSYVVDDGSVSDVFFIILLALKA